MHSTRAACTSSEAAYYAHSYMQDCFADGERIPTVDARQDWKLVAGYERNGSTTLIVKRKWITCDDNDVAIMVRY